MLIDYLSVALDVTIKTTMMVMAGIYFIFSNTVMASLADSQNGAQIMTRINENIINKGFMGMFLISGLGSLYLLFTSQAQNDFERLAAILFFTGTVVVTVVKNVPLNNRLLKSVKQTENIQSNWQHYLQSWVKWNHVRSISAIISVLLMQLGN